MRHFKLFIACMLMAVLGIGQVWAVDQSFAFTTIGSDGWGGYADHTVTCTDGTVYMNASKQSGTITDIPVTKGQPVSFVLSDNTKSLSAVSFTCRQWTTKAQTITLKYSTNGGSSYSALSPSVTSTNFSISSSSLPTGTNAVQITFSSSANQVGIESMSYTLAGSTPDPTVSADPEEVEVNAEAHASQSLDLTYENWGTVTVDEVEATLWNDAACTETFDGGWISNVSVAAGNASVSFDIAANAGAARAAYLKIYALGDDASTEAETVVSISQAKYAAPTGTFELFSGDIEEGDYLIVVDGAGMNTTVSSSRLQYTALTLTGENYVNPDASVIWHVEASDVYWTIYNAEEEKYAAATGSNNQAQMLASGTDDKSLWTITHSGSVYTIQNKSNSRYLKKNGTYGFACYADGTVSLYKKVDGTVKPSAELAYAEADQKKLTKLGDAFTAPTLTNPHSLAVAYESSNTDVAEVAANGAVTIKAVGVAVITASFAGNDDYKEGSASYTIGVTAHAGTEADPYSVADAINVIDGIGTKADAYVSGVISQIDSYSDTYHSITYWISADGKTTGQQLEVFGGKGLDGADFSSVDDLSTKATVVVKGTLKKYSTTYEFDSNNELVSYTEPVDPSVTLKQSGSAITALNVEAASVANQAIDIICANFESAISSVSAKLYGESTCETEITSGAWVTDITVNNEKTQLTFNVADNDGAARQVWMKVTAGDGSSEASAVLAISQAKYNAPASLPFAFDGGRADIEEKQGMSQEGLDTDYGSSPKLKFNSTGDYVIINIAAAPGKLTYDIKNNSFSGGTFDVQESADGETYTSVASYTEITGTQNEEHNLKQETRFVKFIYTNKSSGNVGLGNITIVAPAAVEAPTFSPEGGAYTGTQSVELSCITDGATIYYTTNGDDPDDSSTEYTAAISVDETMTIKAIAYKGNDHSEIASAAYTITPALTDYYEKVTSTANIVDGTYLIVYEEGGLAFDGGLSALDAENNTIDVTITNDHKIGVTNETAAATFFIDVTAGTIQAANGKYIGQGSDANGLTASDNALVNTLSIDESGDAVVVSAGGAYLRYNATSGQERFRYFKSASYTNQQPIALYKLANEVVKQDPGISWDSEAAELTLYDYLAEGDYPEPGLNIVADLGDNPLDFITLSSDNEDLATINKTNDGQIKISWNLNVPGTVHFTATYPGNDTYKAVTAVCTVTIKPANSIYVDKLNVNFGTVTKDATVDDKSITVTLTNVDAATLTLAGDGASAFTISPAAALTASGDITISASSTAVGTYAATLTISDDANQAESKVVNLSLKVNEPTTEETAISTTSKWVVATEVAGGMEVLITGVKSDVTYAISEQASSNRTTVAGTLDEGVFTPGDNTMSFTLVAQDGGKYALRTSNGKYLYAASSSANQLKTRDAIGDDGKAVWTISINGDNEASIVANCETANWRNVMQFNRNGSNNPVVACYASANQSPIKLYVPQTTPPTKDLIRGDLSNGKWGTICPAQNVENVEGAVFYQISYLEEKDGMPYNMVFDEISGTTLTAGQPYFFIATGTEIRGNKTGTELTEVDGVSVNGFYGYIGATVKALPYEVDYTSSGDNTYVIYNNSVFRINGATNLKSERCYINISSTEPSRAVSAPKPQRRRINMSVDANAPAIATDIENIEAGDQPMKRLINGQMFILRGEKMYNVNGQIVK